ncbi:hypothetical protein [Williamsia sp. R60]
MLRDTVTLKVGGGYDENGSPIPTTNVNIRAEIAPVSGDVQFQRARDTKTTTFRLICRDDRIGSVSTVVWRTVTYTLEGKAMPYRIGGRTHHWEVSMSSTVG